MKSLSIYLTSAICCTIALIWASPSEAQPINDVAAEIVDASGVSGGLIVHLGCGDARLTTALRTGDGCLVQGLDVDSERIAAARDYLNALGATGPVSVAQFDGWHLPYIDNVVNLLVVEDSASVSENEMMRVLVPEGVALIHTGDTWRKLVKPRPREIDAWPHFLHGADGNAVADDTVVDMPYHLQWTGGPRYARTHEGVSSVNVAVSDGRRLYYIADSTAVALPDQLPTQWSLVARDAFNGVVLWQRPLNRWQARSAGSRHRYPPDLFRRLVAGDRHLYATLDILGPVVALDPETGEPQLVYEGTEGAEEILYADGTLYVVANPASPETIDRGAMAEFWPLNQLRALMAIEPDSGRVLWRKNDRDTLGLALMSTAVHDGRLVFQNPREVVCLDAGSGELLWKTARRTPEVRPVYGTPTLVLAEDVVLSADRVATAESSRKVKSELIAYDLNDGSELWSIPCQEGSHIPSELFVVDGLVWAGEEPSRAKQDYRLGRNLRTGQVERTLPLSDGWVSHHHHRCYRDKATSRFVLAGRTGVEYIDIASGELSSHHWIRGICKFGILPCNGLLYLPPNQCSCYNESLLNGFNALAPKRLTLDDVAYQTQLVRGPAYAQATPSDVSAISKQDWPTYRADAARSGYTPNALSGDLSQSWSTKLSGQLTAPVVAEGMVFVAAVDRHAVHALDASSGSLEWMFLAGGRVDSPPTIANGMVVFGCRDGWVYAVRARDGELVWKSLAAPGDRQMVANGQCESVWPVHGSVLVEDGRVYCAAGRYSHLDGGVTCRIFDLDTGQTLVTQQHHSRDANTGEHVSLYDPFPGSLLPDRELPGVLPDVPSSDGEHVFLRSVAFDREFKPVNEYVRHLFSSAGFVDDAWYQRSFWIYGNHLFSGLAGRGFNKGYASAGRLLVHDDTRLYGYRDYTLDTEGVFAVQKTAELGIFGSRYPPTKKALNDPTENPTPDVVGWDLAVPFYVRAMVATPDSLLLAGPPKHQPETVHEMIKTRPLETRPMPDAMQTALDAWAGELGGHLWIVDKTDPTNRQELEISTPPVHDGMAVAEGRLYIATMDGSVLCLGE